MRRESEFPSPYDLIEFTFSSPGRSLRRAIVQPPALVVALALAKSLTLKFFSLPEHEVLMVSDCDQSLSVVRHLYVVNFLL